MNQIIQFDDFSISNNGQYLTIDLSIKNKPYYNNLTIKEIYLDTEKTFKLGSKENAIWEATDIPENATTYTNDLFILNDILSLDVKSFNDGLLFLTVVVDGEVGSDAPCGYDNATSIAVTYPKHLIYNKALSMLRELDGCEPPQHLINWFLRTKMIDYAIETGNYSIAQQYWTQFQKSNVTSKRVNCGCHG